MSTITETTVDRPTAGSVETRSLATVSADGQRLRGLIPYGVESRDLGGWREVIEPGALRSARLDDLVATVDHVGVPIGRHPGTLELEDRSDGLHWSVEPPVSRADVREAVQRGDLRGGSWRMIVGRDEWRGDVRHVHEIAELRDVAVVTNPAHPAARVELRSAEGAAETETATTAATTTPPVEDRADTTTAGETRQEDTTTMNVEDRTEGGAGGLKVEDRAADQPNVETRVMDALRSIKKGEARDLTTASAAALAPAEVGTFVFDKLRAASVALASGIRVIPTDRKNITWPQITADVQPDWYAEGETITPGDPTIVALEANPHKLAHIIEVSNEVLDDSEPSAQEVLRDHLLNALAFKLDGSIFEGNPAANADSIRGLKFVAGVQTIDMGANGAPLDSYDVLIQAVGLLQGANVPGPYVAVMNPRTATELALLKTAENEQLPVPAQVPPISTTTQISLAETKGTATDSTSIYVYSPSQLALVRRQDATVELDRSRLFNQDESELRGKTRVDLLVPDATAIVRIVGVTPPAAA